MINSSSLAKRYARALLSIGIENGNFERYGSDLKSFEEIHSKHKIVSQTLENKTISLAQKRAIIDALCKQSRLDNSVRDFLRVLVDRNRIQILDDIARHYEALADRHAERIRGEVVSAVPLDADIRARLESALARAYGKRIVLAARTDARLIGGTLTRIGSMVYDGSVQTTLRQLREDLIESRGRSEST